MKAQEAENHGNEGHIIMYTTSDGVVKVNVVYNNETLWLTQASIAQLFDVQTPAINKHLHNIYEEGELEVGATISKMEIVQTEGGRQVKRMQTFYNLDAIIAVGYRVNSQRATQFRVWATQTLKEFIIKGFVLNDEMLKNGKPFGIDYFDELLERIREIRASERRAYQKIADIFEQCSSDYSSHSEITRKFYAFVQNKLHYAVSQHTAAEIIYSRADSEKPTMGLTTWKSAPDGKILKSDTHIAKNYLNQSEIDKLNRLVVMFIDYAEMRALNRQLMTMNDWVKQVDKFLGYTDQEILEELGSVSHAKAIAKANEEYEKFRVRQDREYLSDFDKEFGKYLRGES